MTTKSEYIDGDGKEYFEFFEAIHHHNHPLFQYMETSSPIDPCDAQHQINPEKLHET